MPREYTNIVLYSNDHQMLYQFTMMLPVIVMNNILRKAYINDDLNVTYGLKHYYQRDIKGAKPLSMYISIAFSSA
jgi:hypothetical protein